MTKRLLAHQNPAVRAAVTQKNVDGTTALDFAACTNNTSLTLFLAEVCEFRLKCITFVSHLSSAQVFFALGEDLNAPEDRCGNTLVHLLGRGGDSAASALKILLSLKTKGSGKKVISTSVANSKEQLPVHMAVMKERCQIETLQLLHTDYPGCCLAQTREKDLPLHYACQFGQDPSTLAMLLHFEPSCVNAKRRDGFTALHLVAARSVRRRTQ